MIGEQVKEDNWVLAWCLYGLSVVAAAVVYFALPLWKRAGSWKMILAVAVLCFLPLGYMGILRCNAPTHQNPPGAVLPAATVHESAGTRSG